MSLTRSEAVLELGRRLVDTLKAEDDLLGGWMAHHLAELISEAESAPPETRSSAQDACAAAILEVWRNRNALPPHLRPLGEAEPVLATIASLSIEPDNFRYHPATLRTAALANAEGEAKRWLGLATGLDYTARVLIQIALRAAAAEAADTVEPWVELAQQAGGEHLREGVLIEFVSSDSEPEPPDARLKAELQDKVRRLRGFVSLASGIADDLQAQIGAPPEPEEE